MRAADKRGVIQAVVVREDAAVEVAALHQLGVRPLVHNLALTQHQNVVGPANLRDAVGDEQRRAIFEQPLDRLLDLVLGRAVNRAGRVVQDQDARIGEQRAGNRQPLPLPARKRHATLADDRSRSHP